MKPTSPAALLVTHSADHFTIDRVAAAVERRGLRAFRLDTDLFPTVVRITHRHDGKAASTTFHAPHGSLDAADVAAVWMRRVFVPRLPADVDPQFREWCERQASTGLRAALGAVRGARFVNDPGRERDASNKIEQLAAAAEEGLATPRTIVTNDPDEVRAAHRLWNGAMVTKLLSALTTEMGAPSAAVYTSPVGEEDLADLDGLRLGPMIFQERVEKARELRVACVGERLFAGAIDASRTEAGRLDWRRSTAAECEWRPGALPDDVGRRLVAVARRLGLVFGAADFIVTPDGRHVFLEINPAGEWGMLERDLGLPISEAIADELAKGAKPAKPSS